MREKSYVARLGAMALVLTLMTTCLMGGTLAKFVTTVTGTATAYVAAWSFKANGETETMSAIDMGSTTNRDTYDAVDIKEGVIAPGTKGTFDILLDGSGSEVGIDYTIKIAKEDGTNFPSDLTFKVDNTSYTLGNDITGTINYNSTADLMKKNITVSWEWDYGSSDTTADNDNEYQGKDWSLNITATGTQTAPTAVSPSP